MPATPGQPLEAVADVLGRQRVAGRVELHIGTQVEGDGRAVDIPRGGQLGYQRLAVVEERPVRLLVELVRGQPLVDVVDELLILAATQVRRIRAADIGRDGVHERLVRRRCRQAGAALGRALG
jgi:hypothetical protein